MADRAQLGHAEALHRIASQPSLDRVRYLGPMRRFIGKDAGHGAQIEIVHQRMFG